MQLYRDGFIKFSPLVEINFRKRRKSVGTSWRMDETYINVKGEWMYLYRAVDKEGNTVDFLLTKRRNLELLTKINDSISLKPKQGNMEKQIQVFVELTI